MGFKKYIDAVVANQGGGLLQLVIYGWLRSRRVLHQGGLSRTRSSQGLA